MKKLVLLLLVALLSACASNRVVPNTPGEAAVDAYGTLEKATVVTTILLRSKVISLERAKAVRSQIAEAYAGLNAATAAIVAGDLDTSVAKLQLAKSIIDELARFVAENQSKLPPEGWDSQTMITLPEASHVVA